MMNKLAQAILQITKMAQSLNQTPGWNQAMKNQRDTDDDEKNLYMPRIKTLLARGTSADSAKAREFQNVIDINRGKSSTIPAPQISRKFGMPGMPMRQIGQAISENNRNART